MAEPYHLLDSRAVAVHRGPAARCSEAVEPGPRGDVTIVRSQEVTYLIVLGVEIEKMTQGFPQVLITTKKQAGWEQS